MQCTLLHSPQQYRSSSDAEVLQDSPEAKLKTEVHHLMLAWKEELQLPHRDDDIMEVDWCIQSNCQIIWKMSKDFT